MPGRINFPSLRRAPRERALTKAGELILDDAKARAPRDSGELIASGRVEMIDDDTARVSFSGPYAVRQNYSKRLAHNTGDALFLNDAVLSQRRAVERALANEVRKILSGS